MESFFDKKLNRGVNNLPSPAFDKVRVFYLSGYVLFSRGFIVSQSNFLWVTYPERALSQLNISTNLPCQVFFNK